MKKLIRNLVYLGLSTTLVTACGEPKKLGTASAEEEIPGTVLQESPLYLKIGLQWEGSTGDNFEIINSCSVPKGVINRVVLCKFQRLACITATCDLPLALSILLNVEC